MTGRAHFSRPTRATRPFASPTFRTAFQLASRSSGSRIAAAAARRLAAFVRAASTVAAATVAASAVGASTVAASIAVGLAVLTPAPAIAQLSTPDLAPAGDSMRMNARSATTWMQSGVSVVQLEGGVTVAVDDVLLSADDAVVWIAPSDSAVLSRQEVTIALIGNARLTRGTVERSGAMLLVTAEVREDIAITAASRVSRDASTSPLYQRAASLRPELLRDIGTTGPASVYIQPSMRPRPQVTAQQARPTPVEFRAGGLETIATPDQRTAIVLSGGVTIFQEQQDGAFIELQAQEAVLFTTLPFPAELGQVAGGRGALDEVVTGAYLEGDVRATFTPRPRDLSLAEQRLSAQRVFYEFTTGRAILTDAVLHTTEPQRRIPLTLRAQTLKQLADAEYRGENVQLSTSKFAVPSYSIKADRIYIRRVEDAVDNADNQTPADSTRIAFSARNATLNAYNIPFFFLPYAGGTIGQIPLRDLEIGSSDRFGLGIRTQWGLYESLGRPRPENLDIAYRIDYFDQRGPAAGVDARYRGGYVTREGEPWNFVGNFESYIIEDHGTDDFGGKRAEVNADDNTRGRIRWEHQHFLPEDWQVQARFGYSSDATFLEQFFRNEFYQEDPLETSLYLKRQRDSEALTLLLSGELNDFPTVSDQVAEQASITRLPELGYYRIGESFGDDRFTFFSTNTVSRLNFNVSEETLLEQGYITGLSSPGLPSYGTTGLTEDETYRGDFRQQIDYPFRLGQYKIVPYVIGRSMPYSDSPEDGSQTRVFGAAGVRVTTAFWKVDDLAQSDLLDIHRLRHVIEPGVNVFTSGQTVDRSELYIYDEGVDDINDVSAVSFSLDQRWQTKRGGPGRWRNVDVFSLNTQANFFTNEPDDRFLRPTNFRGLFFDGLPEASVPRDSVNTEGTWRVSDTTIVIGDFYWNADEAEIATTSIGVAVARTPRLAYFVGTRYIEELDTNIVTFSTNYVLTAKYSVNFVQSFDFSRDNNVYSSASVTRRFDRFYATVAVYSNSNTDESGFRVFVLPEGVSPALPGAIEQIIAPDPR